MVASCSLLIGCAPTGKPKCGPPAQSTPKATQARKAEGRAHPYLFFSEQDLPAIRQRVKQYPASFFFERLGERSDPNGFNFEALSNMRPVPRYRQVIQADLICRCAFYGLVTGSKKHIAKAIDALLEFAKWTPGRYGPSVGHILQSTAIAYDWLYNEMSEGDRAKVEKFLVTSARKLYGTTQQKRDDLWWVAGRDGRQMSHQPILYAALGLIGLNFYDEFPEGRTWTKEAATVMKEVLDENFDADGAGYEAYSTYILGATFVSVYPTLEALRNVTGEDLFGYSDSVLYKSTLLTAYMLHPGREEMVAYGAVGGNIRVVGLQLLKNATEYNDGLAAWYLDTLINDGWKPIDSHLVWGAIWAKQVPVQNPDTSGRLAEAVAYNNRSPKGKWNFGSGQVFLRTGFTDADDIQFAFKAGIDGLGHGAPDKGGYNLNAYGERFLRREMWKRKHKSDGHNLVLIDGAAQQIAQSPSIRIANVDTLESHKGYDYVKLDLTEAYRQHPENEKTRQAYRHVVFVRTTRKNGYFVVIDDVQKDDLPHNYTHGFYFDPKLVSLAEAEGNRIVIAGTKASLHIVAVHPANVKASAEDRDGRPYALLAAPEPVVRFVLVTVLYPVKTGQVVPAFVAVGQGDEVGVEVSGIKIVYDRSAEKVTVSGKLSDIVARNGPVARPDTQ